MYTRCPSCNATFRVTAALLQMAEGEVRCGACGGVFNALQTLVDDWSGADFTLPGAPRLTHPDAPTPAGEIEAEAPKAQPPADETLEFDVPENEWQRYFITQDPPTQRADPDLGEAFDSVVVPEPDVPPDPGVAVDEIFADDDATAEHAMPRSLEAETADTDTWQAFLREAAGGEEEENVPLYVVGDEDGGTQAQVLVRRQATPEPTPPHQRPETQEELRPEPGPRPPAEDRAEPEQDAVPQETAQAFDGAELEETVPGPATHTVLDWGPPPGFSEAARRGPSHAGRWLAASGIAALALIGQAVHYYRDALAADPTYGALVRGIYDRLGLPVRPAWPLDAYEIRDAKAIAENSAPGELDIAAEIAVTGSQPVGLPLVRVVLRDRWSNPVGSGVFNASRYLAEAPPSSGVYAPGTLIPVQISLKDPGSSAQGYELDVCIANRKLGLQCKTTRDPFRH